MIGCADAQIGYYRDELPPRTLVLEATDVLTLERVLALSHPEGRDLELLHRLRTTLLAWGYLPTITGTRFEIGGSR